MGKYIIMKAMSFILSKLTVTQQTKHNFMKYLKIFINHELKVS